MSSEELRQRLHDLARAELSRRGRMRESVVDKLRQPRRILLAAFRQFTASARGGEETSPAAEWLLDNYYIAERALRLVEEEFPRQFEQRLPRLATGEYRGRPVAYAIAREIVDASGHIDLEEIVRLLDELQAIRPLSIAEVWALPILLRVALLERLAAALAEPTTSAADDAASQRVSVEAPAADQIVAGCIHGLRILDSTDWKELFERLNETERVLRRDPAGVYGTTDFETRDRCRRVVEELSVHGIHSEPDVAAKAIALARTFPAGRTAHVGYYLIGAGFDSLAAQVGYRPPLPARWRRAARRRPTAFYFTGIASVVLAHEAVLCAALNRLGAAPWLLALSAVLAFVPLTTVAVSVVHSIIPRVFPPWILPKMDFRDEIPADCATLLAIPVILNRLDDVENLLARMEIHWLSSADHVHVALLSDFPDAPRESMPGDEALLRRLREGVEALNRTHGGGNTGPFHLLHRARRWNPAEGCWMGWERKRGKLSELNRLLAGNGETGFSLHVGDPAVLRSIRFVITLDADTHLPRGAARRLIATLAHPLNQAEIDPRDGSVTAGYSILQPRVEVAPQSTAASRFARLLAGDAGIDLYARAISDPYQDLFGEGIYVGKGIYDVRAFERSVAGRIPQNAILSHDLFEGIHGRVGLVTDVVLLEHYPGDYLSYAKRLHRWARGDWQLLPWLGRRVPGEKGDLLPNRFSLIARWKIADNLRRTLLAPALIAFLVVAWLWLPGVPVVWTLLAILIPAAPALTDAMGGVLVAGAPGAFPLALAGAASNLRSAAQLWALHVAFLPHRAGLMADAVVRTLHRLFFSRRNLLQWVSAEETMRESRERVARRVVWAEMMAGPLTAIALALSVVLLRPAAMGGALPLLLLWFVSPEIALRVSRPRAEIEARLTAAERRRLRRLARRTWLFFESFVGPGDQWLPPDHFQEDPRGVLARRTSPTNIGLLQLATISAHDLGYTGLVSAVLRLRNTMETLSRMERHGGHFYNWYDTSNLDPLEPRYVSSVDSGNLAGCLLAVKQYCHALLDAPVVTPARWDGLADALDVLDEVLQRGARLHGASRFAELETCLVEMRNRAAQVRDEPAMWAETVREISTSGCAEFDARLLEIVHASAESLDENLLAELRVWLATVHEQVQDMARELELCCPWAGMFAGAPDSLRKGACAAPFADLERRLSRPMTLTELGGIVALEAPRMRRLEEQLGAAGEAEDARGWLERLADSLARAEEAARGVLANVRSVAERAARLFDETDFTTLYDARRRLFYLGYNVTAKAMDPHHYDLLASEARLASFIAIAKGDVPYEHWLHLGRPMGRAGGMSVLLSWSATMFEYLMPSLLLREGPDTLLGQSCRAAVRSQIDYAKRRNTPWGISESGYYLLDGQQNYQYRAFGVPDLGFKRGLEDDYVVTPYASLLALRYEPRQVLENLDRLAREGLAGRYGFYEAADYTPSRVPPAAGHAVVRSFMAHHQGMILGALNNFLNADVLVRRFHAEPVVKTAEVLLYERPPSELLVERPRPAVPTPVAAPRPRAGIESWEVPLGAPFPQAHVLSNGRYHLLATDHGSAARWGDVALTRWFPDATLDADGLQVELRDADSGAAWSLASANGQRHLRFHSHMIERGHLAEGIAALEQVTVSPDADMEIHLLSLTNEGGATRRLRLTTHAEVVLGDEREDRRHPAFSKMFVESEYLADLHAIAAHRRRRSPRDPDVWMLHAMVVPEGRGKPSGYEVARDRLLGRGREPSAPLSLRPVRAGRAVPLQAPLDPVMALSVDVEIPPHRTVTVAYTFLVAASREEAIDLARQHRTISDLEWHMDLARRRYESKLSHLTLLSAHLPAVQKLLSLLSYPHRALRAAPAVLADNRAGQSSLWRHGVSGDHPVLLLRIDDELADPVLLQTLLQAHRHWRESGIMIDLVLLNERPGGYADEVEERMARVLAREGASGLLQQPGGVFPLRSALLAAEERSVLFATARVVLGASEGDVEEQIAGALEAPGRLPPLEPTLAGPIVTEPLERPSDLSFDNGLGGFSPDGREYVIHLEPGAATPAPWVNVIANPRFGAIVSESGGGCTWAENSGENRLTPWRNDSVLDPPGDVVYLRDEETAAVWTPTPRPAPAPHPYQCRHGAGRTTFRHRSHGLDQELCKLVPWDEPLQIVTLRLTNCLDRPRRITATYYVEWVLGRTRDVAQQFVVPEFDAESGALLARNPWNEDFATRVAFAAASEKLHGLTGDRSEFLGRHGDYSLPAALRRIGLASAVAPGFDPCAALQVHVDLAPRATTEIHFLLGQAADRAEALALIRKYRDRSAVRLALEELGKRWDEILGAVTVETPSPALNLMVNRWLLYQAITCRLWGRSSQYQSSGAFGFRDQLQDAMALVHTKPELCRAHILEAARHQFEEGDVLHWWHPPSDAGVRTRCSDDLLWLPFVTEHYVAATGDETILDESVPLLAGAALEPGKAELYARFRAGERAETLYEHCCAAIRRGRTAGTHGLPLFGAGDWNDGMNRVGILGRGESVWLGWFLYAILTRFAPLCERRGDEDRAAAFRADAGKLREALEASAWDGAWYRRGYYDDGRPLGSAQNGECRIDSISQSWAVLSSAAEPERARAAMDAVCELLDGDDELVRLLTPPFTDSTWTTGYIAAYPPGIRENGGQYTHAATWVIWALASLGDGDRATALLEKLLPIAHATTSEQAARYRIEPYVVAADVYAGEPYHGRGGWSWYTGAAGWMYRVSVEAILGIRFRADGLHLDPCIPSHWPGFEATVRDDATVYEIHVENPDRANHGVRELSVDGTKLSSPVVPRLRDGGHHQVRVRLG